MKRIIRILMIMGMTLSLIGCSGSDSDGSKSAGTQKVESEKTRDTSYDVDLTKLSSTMIYSEVYNMMCEPEKYIGKTVCMKGQFTFYQVMDAEGKPVPDKMYFACIIADATACCSQGLEFILAGEHTYPDDYPELGEDIVVAGVFETYIEDGYTYCHLVDAVLE